jgi:hypothetical protein
MSVSIGDITKRVKSNKQNIKINLNVNPEFEQTNVIKKRAKQNLDKLTKEDDTDGNDVGDIIYNENEVINIPKKLDNLFDNLLYDNYYLYGISISDYSFLNSLLYVLLSDFKFKNTNDQGKVSFQLKTNLLNELPDYFKKNKYGKMLFKKTEMEDNIEKNLFESAELHYLSDYYNINLVVLDYYKFTYHAGNYNEDNKNIIIVKYNEIYLPLIHIFGEYPGNLIYKCIINKLKINNLSQDSSAEAVVEAELSFNKVAVPPPPYIEPGAAVAVVGVGAEAVEPVEEVEAVVAVEPVEAPIKLKGYSAYKLNELQELAVKHNINIKLDNDKKKTKKQLYDDLKLI